MSGDHELVNRGLVKFAIGSAVFWLLAMTTTGLLTSLKFIYPDFLGFHYPISFGTMRISHVNGVIFAWWLTGAMGISYYMLPRLTGRRLFAEPLAWLVIIAWDLGLAAGFGSFALGYNQGIELGEFVWPIDLAVSAVLLGWCVVVAGTVLTRKEPKIYVTLWYLMAGAVWTFLNYTVGNFALGFVVRGIDGADLHGFYLHNLVGLTITPIGVGIAYYFVPAAADRPLYSHKLSLLGFWTIAFVYPFSGAHHYIFSPIPNWVQTTAIAFSLMLFIPVITVVFNLFASMTGRWDRLIGDPVLKYLMVGTFFYMAVCTQGPLQALRAVQEATHFSDWVIAHSHMAILGTFTFWSMGAIYHLWPRVTGRVIDRRLANAQFWLALLGICLMIASLTAGGLMQAGLWRDAAVQFAETIAWIKPYWAIRSFSGLMLVASFFLFVHILASAKRPAGGETPKDIPAAERPGEAIHG